MGRRSRERTVGPHVVVTIEVPVSTSITVDRLVSLMTDLARRVGSLVFDLEDDQVAPGNLIEVSINLEPGR